MVANNADAPLLGTLGSLLRQGEDEVVEFKQARNSFDSDRLGRYFSALSNEANLRGKACAWLVFGVDDNRNVVGTAYKADGASLQADKQHVHNETKTITFRDIHEVSHPDGRVVMFNVPAAPTGIPVHWKGHYYGRAGDSLVALGLEKVDVIRGQSREDWSAKVVERADASHLDAEALKVARMSLAEQNTDRLSPAEVRDWSVDAFLERAALTIEGNITRAALLLLGKKEAMGLLNPHPAELTWKYVDGDREYQHFNPPFILATTALFNRLRNKQLRILRPGKLYGLDVAKYERTVILEAAHNCIAHQDYHQGARINVIEHPDRVVFESVGGFFDGDPEDHVLGDTLPQKYRNPVLVRAMTNLGLIDRLGYGIRRIYESQRKRCLPLPDFESGSQDKLRLTIHGSVLDSAYSELLTERDDLPLGDVVVLDRIQKGSLPSGDVIADLRSKRLIEGRRPNIRISSQPSIPGEHAKSDPQLLNGIVIGK